MASDKNSLYIALRIATHLLLKNLTFYNKRFFNSCHKHMCIMPSITQKEFIRQEVLQLTHLPNAYSVDKMRCKQILP